LIVLDRFRITRGLAAPHQPLDGRSEAGSAAS
jgi:hypothetical protein